MSQSPDEIGHHDRRIGFLPLPQQVVRDNPVITAQVDGDDRAFQVVACQPRHGVLVYQAVGIEENEARVAIPPVKDILADAVFEEF